jgi:surface antigen
MMAKLHQSSRIHMKKLVSILAATVLLAACQNQQGYGGSGGGFNVSKQDAGTVLGGVGGALLGSQIGSGTGQLVSVAAGTLLGAALGNSIGQSLDRADLNYYNQASQRALETGQSGRALPWRNPESGVGGSVTPGNYYQNASGQYCREYSQTINVGGRTEQGHGTACRQPDGTWQIVN